MRIVLCDDNRLITDDLREKIRAWESKNGFLENEITVFCNAELLLDAVKTQKFDLYFLDIELGEKKDGYYMAKEIRQTQEQAMLVFLSDYDTYLREGYELGVLRYFHKPLDSTKLENVLNLCKNACDNRASTIIISNDGEKLIVPVKDIQFIEYYHHQIQIYTDKSTFKTRIYGSFNDYCAQFPASGFLKCSQSHLINLSYVTAYTKQFVVMTSGITIPISRTLHSSALKMLSVAFSGGQ